MPKDHPVPKAGINMSGNLYIIRHGKTAWNEMHKLQGQVDIPLSGDGIKLAKEAAAKYRDVNFDICYCSPLKRASETAQILLEGRDVPVLYDDRLKEMNFGVCEGITDYFDDNGSPVSDFFNRPEKYDNPPEGAESMDELFKRTGDFLEEMVYPELEKEKDVLIVGHGAMNSAIISQIKKLPRSMFWSEGIENCELKKLM